MVDAGAREGWKLVWSDEFNYSGAPDPSTWVYEQGFIRNEELQYYTFRGENVRVESGMLVIEIRKERYPNAAYRAGPQDWIHTREFADVTSGSITTQGTAQWKYGRVEVWAKDPSCKGTWSAIWMQGNSIHTEGWPSCGEIDIMEHVGFDPDIIYATVHTGDYNHTKNNPRGSSLVPAKPHEAFYAYGAEWDRSRIDFFVDDTVYFTAVNDGVGHGPWPFDGEHFLLLNAAFGGGWGGREGVDMDALP